MRSMLLALLAATALVTTAQAKDVTVAVTAIVEHPALDAARDGVKDALAAAGFKEGENLKFVYQSAQGNPATAAQIARHFNVSRALVEYRIKISRLWDAYKENIFSSSRK